MEGLAFSWDERKDRANQRKHRVSFEEAKSVFSDEYARLMADPDHSESEDRYLLLGLSAKLRLLVVAHAYYGKEEVIRIISARRANRSEQRQYREFRHER